MDETKISSGYSNLLTNCLLAGRLDIPTQYPHPLRQLGMIQFLCGKTGDKLRKIVYYCKFYLDLMFFKEGRPIHPDLFTIFMS